MSDSEKFNCLLGERDLGSPSHAVEARSTLRGMRFECNKRDNLGSNESYRSNAIAFPETNVRNSNKAVAPLGGRDSIISANAIVIVPPGGPPSGRTSAALMNVRN